MTKAPTSYFLHLGGDRTADGKKNYARYPDGRRKTFTHAEACDALRAELAAGNTAAHIRPCFDLPPQSQLDADQAKNDADKQFPLTVDEDDDSDDEAWQAASIKPFSQLTDADRAILAKHAN